MIELTRINGTKISINPFQIEFIEETVDTVILFNSGRKMVVKEHTSEIYEKITDMIGEGFRKGFQKFKGA